MGNASIGGEGIGSAIKITKIAKLNFMRRRLKIRNTASKDTI